MSKLPIINRNMLIEPKKKLGHLPKYVKDIIKKTIPFPLLKNKNLKLFLIGEITSFFEIEPSIIIRNIIVI